MATRKSGSYKPRRPKAGALQPKKPAARRLPPAPSGMSGAVGPGIPRRQVKATSPKQPGADGRRLAQTMGTTTRAKAAATAKPKAGAIVRGNKGTLTKATKNTGGAFIPKRGASGAQRGGPGVPPPGVGARKKKVSKKPPPVPGGATHGRYNHRLPPDLAGPSSRRKR